MRRSEDMSHRAIEIQGKVADYARILRENLPGLHERYGVVSLGIFGSFVRGEERPDSALDVLVDFSLCDEGWGVQRGEAPAPVLSSSKGRESEGVPQIQLFPLPGQEGGQGDGRKGFSP